LFKGFIYFIGRAVAFINNHLELEKTALSGGNLIIQPVRIVYITGFLEYILSERIC